MVPDAAWCAGCCALFVALFLTSPLAAPECWVDEYWAGWYILHGMAMSAALWGAVWFFLRAIGA